MRLRSGTLVAASRRGSLLIDVVVAIMIFVGALTTFLALASENGKLLTSISRRAAALGAAQSHLAELDALSIEELRRKDGHRVTIDDFPGGRVQGKISVRDGELPDVLRVEVTIEWMGGDGHQRRLVLTHFRAPYDRHERAAR